MAKQAVFRQVKSMNVGCDPVGNLVLAKFSYQGAPDSCVVIPASIVFWLLEHIPANQDPELAPPPGPRPQFLESDWDFRTPRVLSVNCKQFMDAVRMTMELDRKPDLTVLLDRSNLELMRLYLAQYSGNLMNLDAE